MASAEQIKALVHSHLDGDEEQFYSVAMQMAAAAARKGQGKFAQELRSLIDQARSAPSIKPVNAPTPISRPRGELADLLTVSYPKVRLTDMTLDERLANSLKRILNEHSILTDCARMDCPPAASFYSQGIQVQGKQCQRQC